MMLITRKLGITDYQTTLAAMQAFTNNRQDHTDDELWLTEHPSVYTLGLNRKNIRLPDNAIPVVNVDRGGKITYHGLGQAVIYCLLDLYRRQLKVRALVDIIEDSIVSLLAQYQLVASTQANAPGVYIGTKKIASVGLRLKTSYCYHGLSLNIDMDLKPFQAIDPCGYAGLEMTQTKDWNIQESSQSMGESLLEILKKQLIT